MDGPLRSLVPKELVAAMTRRRQPKIGQRRLSKTLVVVKSGFKGGMENGETQTRCLMGMIPIHLVTASIERGRRFVAQQPGMPWKGPVLVMEKGTDKNERHQFESSCTIPQAT